MEWRKRLYDFEEDPPPGMWDKIDMTLRREDEVLRTMLLEHEEIPPADNWNRISQLIPSQNPAIPVWYRRPLTYITAAAATVAAVLFFADPFDSGRAVTSKNVSASVYNKKTNTNQSLPIPQVGPPDASAAQNGYPDIAVRADSPENDANYIYLTTYSGEQKRVSYKFEKLLQEMKKQDGKTISQWKDKLQQVNFAPTGTNFFDIAEMMRLLEEDKK